MWHLSDDSHICRNPFKTLKLPVLYMNRFVCIKLYVFKCIPVVLLASGEVYTFGSNQYGQLGQGDVNVRYRPHHCCSLNN